MSKNHRTSTRRLRRLGLAAVVASGLLTGLVPGLPTPTASAAEGVTGGYIALAPYRVCDTRADSVATVEVNQCNDDGDGDILGPNGTLGVDVTDNGEYDEGADGAVPPGAASVVLNVAVTGPAAAGHLIVYPDSQANAPDVATLNFAAGQTVPNLVQVGLDTEEDPRVKIRNASTGSSHIVVDVLGYTIPEGEDADADEYFPLTPERICDSRSSSSTNQCNGNDPEDGRLGADEFRDIDILGEGDVPDDPDVVAVVLNVAVTNTSAAGHLTVYPTDADLDEDESGKPPASNLNWVAGQTVANRVVVPVGDNGQVRIHNSAGNTDYVVDVNGYYDAVETDGALYTPLTSPVRICDTRLETTGTSVEDNQCNLFGAVNGILGGPDFAVIDGLDFDDAPGSAAALVTNVAVTGTTAASHLRIWPGGELPTISDLNWPAGRTISNLAVPTLADNGTFRVYNNAGAAHVIVDVQGVYAPG